MRANRSGRTADTTEENTTVESTENTTQADDTTATDTATTDPASTETETKRAARPALEVGEVIVRKSVRDDLKSRPSPTQSNPVFLAVKSADFDTPTDLLADADKVENVKKILRRSAQPELLNVGMTIFPGHPVAVDEEGNEIPGKLIVTFQKSREKKVKGKGSDASS